MKQYRVGDTVKGRILKREQWGASVEIDKKFTNINCFVIKGEFSNLFYVNDASSILENEQEYRFIIKSIDSEKQRVLLSRKQFFDKTFDALDLKYDQPHKVRVIGKTSTGEYVVENNDCFQGLLVTLPTESAKKIRITIGSYLEVYIARIDRTQKVVEVHISQ